MLKKIRVDDLEIGMFVSDFNVPWVDHPFLTSTKLLRKAKEIDKVRSNNISEVYIDTSKGKDSSKAVSAKDAQASVVKAMEENAGEGAASAGKREPEDTGTDPTEAGEYDEELHRARAIYQDATAIVTELLNDLQAGREFRPERAIQVADQMTEAHLRNQDALSGLSRIKGKDRYLFHHSVNVCLISLKLGRHLGLTGDELQRLSLGAILHDIGKTKVPDSAYNKPGDLTEQEFAVMKTHPLHGAKMILQSEEIPDDCARVALGHHERYTGGGYPRGMDGVGIGKFGLITAIADVYDAVTSDRVYRRHLPPHVAMQRIYEWGKRDFYPVYVQKFIQCMGIYPAGTVVWLENGEVAVVVRQNLQHLLRPHVRVVVARDGTRLATPYDLNLAKAQFIDNRPVVTGITDAMTAGEAGIDVNAVLDLPTTALAA